MQILYSAIVLMAAALFASPELSVAQDISRAHSILRDSQKSVGSIRLLSKSYQLGNPKLEQFSTDIASAIERLEESRKQLGTIEGELLNDFKASFAKLHVHEKLAWRVALRHKALLDEMPTNIKIQSKSQTVVIRKTGNPKGRPVAPSPTYHVCPDVPFEDGDRASVTLSTPLRSTRGGTPVPYFGIRDARGHEHPLGSLGGFAGDGKTHTILVQRVGNEGLAILDGKLASLQVRPPIKELTPPIFLFFHMNDTSEVVIHSIQFSRAFEHK